jgi:hypothetical protein
MSLIPTWPFVAGALLIGAAGGAALDHTIMAGKIDRMELAAAKSEAADAAQALADYKTAAEVIANAALGAQTDLAGVNAQLAAIRKGQKNAPPPPLPVDCRPGAVRLRNLAETAAAADKAIAGQVPGK